MPLPTGVTFLPTAPEAQMLPLSVSRAELPSAQLAGG